MSMCFEQCSCAGLEAKNIAPWLSPHKAISLISKFSSLNNDSMHTICLVVSLRHMYSASVEDNATVFCFLETQLTAPPASFIMFPVTDFLLMGSLAQSASAYAINPSWFCPSYIIFALMCVLMYRTICNEFCI